MDRRIAELKDQLLKIMVDLMDHGPEGYLAIMSCIRTAKQIQAEKSAA